MPRILGAAQNSLRINDPQGGEPITLFYRNPTNKERAQYQTSTFKVRGAGRVEIKTFETRLEFGLRIITGFKEGDFLIEENGQPVPFSSWEGARHYRADWKALLEKNAGDLICFLAAFVFDGVTSATEEETHEPEEVEERKNSFSSSTPISVVSAE